MNAAGVGDGVGVAVPKSATVGVPRVGSTRVGSSTVGVGAPVSPGAVVDTLPAGPLQSRFSTDTQPVSALAMGLTRSHAAVSSRWTTSTMVPADSGSPTASASASASLRNGVSSSVTSQR